MNIKVFSHNQNLNNMKSFEKTTIRENKVVYSRGQANSNDKDFNTNKITSCVETKKIGSACNF